MLFNSLQYILFFLAFFLILFSLPISVRKPWLLIASCYFYMVFKPVYLLILFIVILIDFYTGKQIENSNSHKKSWLILSLVSNLGILVFYKYYNFLNENISFIADFLGFENHIPALDIILPIGLSFHTFQAMSYTIEVYRGKQQAEKNLLNYSLYVLYFPQLVAGPIERPQELLPQLKKPFQFDYSNLTSGLFRISIGFFKKVVIADRLALFVDPVYSNLSEHNGLSILLATVFFAFEIYCDFSGYTDIALGTSRMMGITLMENFKNPYTATSLREFWSRWHISLSSWFRDYVYIPLGGNRTSTARWAINLLIVFFLSGLWHGARWNFVAWGVIHGTLLILERFIQKNIKFKLPAFLSGCIVFACTCFAWIFFRANGINDAFLAIEKIAQFSFEDQLAGIFHPNELFFAFFLILLLVSGETFIKKSRFKNHTLLILLSCIIILLSYLFGEFNYKEFIYFQF
ncbi:MAG TPA: MBOAT family O-acyltransferase [Bacteroidia bacterium]|jgi:D-alanyl-lipoteichoic acid acyltransferase DltB (MBOAT superfamily)|nr:MBOAT family O-acyltransferase [Bacteroidia bacterium]